MGVKRNTKRFWVKVIARPYWKRIGDSISLRCPKCKTWKGIDRAVINHEGHIDRMVSCGEMIVLKVGKKLTQERCMFSEYIQLKGWRA